MKINFDVIESMTIGLTQGKDLFGWAERIALGQLFNLNCPTHAFIVVTVNGLKFVLEESAGGLRIYSLNEYNDKNNRIIYMCRWKYWNETNSEIITSHALQVISEGGASAEYDTKGLFSFIPIVNLLPWFQPDPKKDWCSENVADLSNAGQLITDVPKSPVLFPKTTISPCELMKELKANKDFIEIKNYYV